MDLKDKNDRKFNLDADPEASALAKVAAWVSDVFDPDSRAEMAKLSEPKRSRVQCAGIASFDIRSLQCVLVRNMLLSSASLLEWNAGHGDFSFFCRYAARRSLSLPWRLHCTTRTSCSQQY